MNGIKCFLLEPTGISRVTLRRYKSESKCVGKFSYHNVNSPPIGEFKEIEKDGVTVGYEGLLEDIPRNDPRWPTLCECGYVFTPDDVFQVSKHSLYKRADTGEMMTLREAPEGAIWREPWWEDCPSECGLDGKSYSVRMPFGHGWKIDTRASNCTMKNDNVHKCWCRHGEAPNFTVDKNGFTCQAGAGSIQCNEIRDKETGVILRPGWHGFLRNGYLVTG